jgi:anti-sigma B factor antagonist
MTLPSAIGALTVETRHEMGLTVVVLSGELDLATAGLVRETLDRIHGEAPARLAIDLRGLSFIDSTGVALFAAEAARAGREFELEFWRGPTAIQRLFDIAGVGDRLPFAEPPSAAR